MKRVILSALAISSIAFAGKNVAPVAVPPVSVPSVAPAAISSNGVALKVGTLGVGVDFEHMFNQKFGMRLNVNGFKLNKTKTYDEIKYKAKLKLLSAGLLADYHPWGSMFRVSGGVYYNNNKITGTARPTGTVTYGGKTYNVGEIGRIDAKIDFKKVAPYLGIGWSSTESSGWHFTTDIGVMYVGKPRVNLKAHANDPTIQNDLDSRTADEEAKVYKDVKKYKWWPVISIGIERKF